MREERVSGGIGDTSEAATVVPGRRIAVATKARARRQRSADRVRESGDARHAIDTGDGAVELLRSRE